MAPGGLGGGIAGVDQVDKLHAFDHAAAMDVEAGDDALGQHDHSRKFCNIINPVAPDFSG